MLASMKTAPALDFLPELSRFRYLLLSVRLHDGIGYGRTGNGDPADGIFVQFPEPRKIRRNVGKLYRWFGLLLLQRLFRIGRIVFQNSGICLLDVDIALCFLLRDTTGNEEIEQKRARNRKQPQAQNHGFSYSDHLLRIGKGELALPPGSMA